MEFSDRQLFEKFVRDANQKAFAELVKRHLPLVHAVAMRVTRNPSAAEEVSQMVFSRLAATRTGIREGVSMAAWLHRATRLAALDFIRSENRRRARERIAAEHQAMNRNSSWEEIAPVLDEVIDHLSAQDRELVLSRYFQGKSHATIGNALGLTEDATRMRVNRALEKLRTLLVKRGVTTTAAALTLALPAHAVVPVSAGLTASISTAALTGTTAFTSLHLLNLGLFTMTTKTAIISAVILALGTTAIWKVSTRDSFPTAGTPVALNNARSSSGESSRRGTANEPDDEGDSFSEDDTRVLFNKQGNAREKEFRARFQVRLDNLERAATLTKEQKQKILAAAQGDFIAARELFSQSEDMRVGGEEGEGAGEVDLTRVDGLDRAVVGLLTREQQERYAEFKIQERKDRIDGLAERNMSQTFTGITPNAQQHEAILQIFRDEATTRYDGYPYTDFTHLYEQYQNQDLLGIDQASVDPNPGENDGSDEAMKIAAKARWERIKQALDRRSDLLRPHLTESQLRLYRQNLEKKVLEEHPDLSGN